TGVSGMPSPSTSVPSVMFADPFSRGFAYLNSQAVTLGAAPASLKTPNNITLSVFYRAMRTDTSGSEIISLGDNYNLRLAPTRIEWNKHVGGGMYVHCFATVANYLDGNWHHLAAVTTPAGIQMYFDGAMVCSTTDGGDVVYDRGTDFW